MLITVFLEDIDVIKIDSQDNRGTDKKWLS